MSSKPSFVSKLFSVDSSHDAQERFNQRWNRPPSPTKLDNNNPPRSPSPEKRNGENNDGQQKKHWLSGGAGGGLKMNGPGVKKLVEMAAGAGGGGGGGGKQQSQQQSQIQQQEQMDQSKHAEQFLRGQQPHSGPELRERENMSNGNGFNGGNGNGGVGGGGGGGPRKVQNLVQAYDSASLVSSRPKPYGAQEQHRPPPSLLPPANFVQSQVLQQSPPPPRPSSAQQSRAFQPMHPNAAAHAQAQAHHGHGHSPSPSLPSPPNLPPLSQPSGGGRENPPHPHHAQKRRPSPARSMASIPSASGGEDVFLASPPYDPGTQARVHHNRSNTLDVGQWDLDQRDRERNNNRHNQQHQHQRGHSEQILPPSSSSPNQNSPNDNRRTRSPSPNNGKVAAAAFQKPPSRGPSPGPGRSPSPNPGPGHSHSPGRNPHHRTSRSPSPAPGTVPLAASASMVHSIAGMDSGRYPIPVPNSQSRSPHHHHQHQSTSGSISPQKPFPSTNNSNNPNPHQNQNQPQHPLNHNPTATPNQNGPPLPPPMTDPRDIRRPPSPLLGLDIPTSKGGGGGSDHHQQQQQQYQQHQQQYQQQQQYHHHQNYQNQKNQPQPPSPVPKSPRGTSPNLGNNPLPQKQQQQREQRDRQGGGGGGRGIGLGHPGAQVQQHQQQQQQAFYGGDGGTPSPDPSSHAQQQYNHHHHHHQNQQHSIETPPNQSQNLRTSPSSDQYQRSTTPNSVPPPAAASNSGFRDPQQQQQLKGKGVVAQSPTSPVETSNPSPRLTPSAPGGPQKSELSVAVATAATSSTTPTTTPTTTPNPVPATTTTAPTTTTGGDKPPVQEKPPNHARSRSNVDLSRTFAKIQAIASNAPPSAPTTNPASLQNPPPNSKDKGKDKASGGGHGRSRSEYPPLSGGGNTVVNKKRSSFEIGKPKRPSSRQGSTGNGGGGGSGNYKSRRRSKSNSMGLGMAKAVADELLTGKVDKKQVEKDFEKLMDTLQVPNAVRTKMSGLDSNVKIGMLRTSSGSSQNSAPLMGSISSGSSMMANAPTPKTPKFPGLGLKKSRSSADLKGNQQQQQQNQDVPDGFELVAEPHQIPLLTEANVKAINSSTTYKSNTAANKAAIASLSLEESTPAHFVMLFKTKSLKGLGPVDVRNLRVLLRNETPAWINEWAKLGGYCALVKKVKDVLELEWREEQHDDQVLHELLKCFKALMTTEYGRAALASLSPTPFIQLMGLLLSEKRPGDIPVRQLIVEIVLGLFDIFPNGARAVTNEEWSKPIGIELDPQRNVNSDDEDDELPPPPGRGSSPLVGGGYSPTSSPRRGGGGKKSSRGSQGEQMHAPGAYPLVRSLVGGPPDEKEESKVDFIQSAHRPRLYKRWLQEVTGVLMDYFWIFCHSQNTFGFLKVMDEEEMEAPKVPGGMTGGVEFEAMAYCAAHFRLINALARRCPSETEAYRFHYDLFESGMERILMTLRKCSTTYYPHVHLELARYISLARTAHFDLGSTVTRYCNGISDVEKKIAAARAAAERAARSPQSQQQQTFKTEEQAGAQGSPQLPPLRF